MWNSDLKIKYVSLYDQMSVLFDSLREYYRSCEHDIQPRANSL